MDTTDREMAARVERLETDMARVFEVVGRLATRVSVLEGLPIAAEQVVAAVAVPVAVAALPELAPVAIVPEPEAEALAPVAIVPEPEAEALAPAAIVAEPEETLEYDEPEAPVVLPEPKPAVDWERLIGGRWALWVGSLAIFLSVAFFLAYAWQFVPPIGKAAMGLGFGAALIGAGRLARTRAEGWFGAGLAGAGLGILYLNIWSAMHIHQLIGPDAAFVALGITCALGAALAVRDDEPILLLVASVGGILTPLVMQATVGGGLPDVGLRAYVGILNTGLLVVSLTKRWPPTTWVCFLGTVILVASTGHFPGNPWEGFAFAALYFVQFAGTACLYSLRRQEASTSHDLHLLVSASLIFPVTGYWLVQAQLGDWRVVYPLAVAALFAGLSYAGMRLWPANGPFRTACVALGVTYLTMAVPLQLKDDGLAVGWLVEATLLETLGILLIVPRFCLAARGVAVPAAIALMIALASPNTRHMVLLSESALPLFLAVLCAGWLVALKARQARLAPPVEALPTGEAPAAALDMDGEPIKPGPLALTNRLAIPAGIAAPALVGGGVMLWLMEAFHLVDWKLLAPAVGSHDFGQVAAVLLSLWAVGLFQAGRRLDHPVLRHGAAIAMGFALFTLGLGGLLADVGELVISRPIATAVVALALLGCRWGLPKARTPQETLAADAVPAVLAGLAFWFVSLEIHDAIYLGLPGTETEWLAIAWILLAAGLETLSLRRRVPFMGPAARLIALPAAIAIGVTLRAITTRAYPLVSEAALALVVAVAAAAWLVILKGRPAPSEVTEPVLAEVPPEPMVNADGVLVAATDSPIVPKEQLPALPAGISAMALAAGGTLLWVAEAIRYVDWKLLGALVGPHDVGHLTAVLVALWALGLYRLGARLDRPILRTGAVVSLGVAIAALVGAAFPAPAGELVFTRPVAAAAVAFALIAIRGVLAKRGAKPFEGEVGALAAVPLGLLALGVWLLSFEVYDALWRFGGADSGRMAHMGVSLAWIASGVFALLAGIRSNERNFRLAGLGLLGMSCLKVFLSDLSYLDLPFRVLSFGGLGAALIGISWLYGRFGVGEPKNQ